MQVIKAIYDAYPEAIEDDSDRLFSLSNNRNCHQQVRTFISEELVHAILANNHEHMSTVDENGQLPLHYALRKNVRLGSIRLLMKGYPDAIRHADSNGALPLHLACQHHNPKRVIQYLADLDPATLRGVDNAGNTALHFACRGVRYATIALLLGKSPVSKRNENGKLHIEVLFDEVLDRESVDYIDCVFRLLKAHPHTLTSFGPQPQSHDFASAASSSQVGLKREFGDC